MRIKSKEKPRNNDIRSSESQHFHSKNDIEKEFEKFQGIGIDIKKFEEIENIIKIISLKEKYGLNLEKIDTLLKKEVYIPTSTFNGLLTILETTVKYLKEEQKLNLKNISELTGRDQRNIWQIYRSASEKFPQKLTIKKSGLMIPVTILSSTKLSAFESVVVFLKESHNLNYHQIAVLLHRNDRTIWTVYMRAKQKNEK